MNHDLFRPIPQFAKALNDVAAFLALNDFGATDPESAMAPGDIDCIVLAGNSVLHTAEQAFRLVRNGVCDRLLMTGGIGHSTHLLWQEVARHETYGAIAAAGRPEAQIFRDIAETFWDMDPSRLLVEAASTNTGENASFSRRLLEGVGATPKTILLIQDPTMQRRTDATFRQVWRDREAVRFLNWPTLTPSVRLEGTRLEFAVSGVAGSWSLDRFISLVMGEIPRLRNDPAGYGPRGRGFIVPVDIPERIETAYAFLADRLGTRAGERAGIVPAAG